MNPDPETEVLKRVRAELDRGTRELDELTVARLRAARHRALDARPHRRLWWAAAGLAATAATASLVAILMVSPAPTPPANGLEQIDLLADADIELFENLEFYRWLAERQDAG
jgi:hypothetical protein